VTDTDQMAALPPPAAAHGGPRVAIVTCMKNEGPFALDWIAYHRAIGIGDFLIYTNDCDDGTDALLDRLALRGAVRRLDNPFDKAAGDRPQHAALRDAPRRAPVAGADWVLPIDVDEYLAIHAGDGTFRDLLCACEGLAGRAPDLISITWRLFGNDGTTQFADRPVIAQFTRCAAEYRPKPHQAWGFKTAFRQPLAFERFGVHRPVKPLPGAEDALWLDGSGRPMPPDMVKRGWRSDRRCWGYGLASLNHYAVRSAESFLVKRARGRVNHVDRDQGLAYWWVMNRNEAEDHRIRRMIPAMRAELRALKADPEVRRLHQACLSAHRRKIKALRADPAQADLLAQIAGPRLDALSRENRAYAGQEFANGPPPP
jgi:hypothetical protein